MKALVLSSGGVDSTTALALAVSRYGKDNVIALSVSYRQTSKIQATVYFCITRVDPVIPGSEIRFLIL